MGLSRRGALRLPPGPLGEHHLLGWPGGRHGNVLLAPRPAHLADAGQRLEASIGFQDVTSASSDRLGRHRRRVQGDRIRGFVAAGGQRAAGSTASERGRASACHFWRRLRRPQLVHGWHQGGLLACRHARAVPRQRVRANVYVSVLPREVRAAHGVPVDDVLGLLIGCAAIAAGDVAGSAGAHDLDNVLGRCGFGDLGVRHPQPQSAARRRQRHHSVRAGQQLILRGGHNYWRAAAVSLQRWLRDAGVEPRNRLQSRRPRCREDAPTAAWGGRRWQGGARIRLAPRLPLPWQLAGLPVVLARHAVRARRRGLPAID
mmetsp:Transcript_34782/g.99945  ORF Transcript_34782/g.99945 Transcript_34782/m.99945 type:complete len:316 (+) Transcript_34782:290-1237(+)